MNDRPTTPEGTPVGGWVLVAPEAAPVTEALKAFGQVHRWPVPAGPRAELLAAGQPCFLVVTEEATKVRPGLWAVGEVVGPVTADPGLVEGAVWAEVELLPLASRIPLATVLADERLVRSELVTDPHGSQPRVLHPNEVRALEDHDFDFRVPTDDQVARLDEALAAEDPLVLEVVGVDRSIAVADDGHPEGLLAVVTFTDDGTFELGRYAAFVDALDAVTARIDDLELPDAADDDGPGVLVATLRTDDGPLFVSRTGPNTYALHHDPDEAPARFDDLAGALAAIGEAVEEIDGPTDDTVDEPVDDPPTAPPAS